MNIFYRESTKHIHTNSVNINVSKEKTQNKNYKNYKNENRFCTL